MTGAPATRTFEIEVAASRTWPTSVLREVDGWRLRSCPVLDRKRSNSALPPRELADVADSVDRVERFYRESGSEPVVQVSPAEQHGALDAFLAARGYRYRSPTEVLTAEVGAVAGLPSSECRVTLHDSPAPEWLSACDAVGAAGEPSLDRIAAPVAFVVAERAFVPAGVALVAVSGPWAGVYCVATSPQERGRGVGRAVIAAGARWAAAEGAGELFLQVESSNESARAVFGRIGFTRSHGYHYRVRDSLPDAPD